MKIGEFCNREVVVINSDESVKVAAELMRTHHVGDLVLVEEKNKKLVPIGIITYRDLVLEVMASGLTSDSLTVRDILTEPLVFLFENDSFFDALDLMHTQRVRRLPIVNSDHSLVGIIIIDDMIDILSEKLTQIVSLVKLQQKREAKKRA
ncbi:CBS domain-containing protein [Legionella feeleii]|uniref:CBS domain protein n=1 Tax=Legionella feeleii TaxID=453 RepID=A0A378IUV5_9GAMM|nr:CBS domain-containing protein [Legionella feeleii]STX38355.1 CBS domain protein [Legionella feeleii]